MATSSPQGVSSSLRANHSIPASNNYLYAQLQQAGVGSKGAPDCRIPRQPLTPRAPNQLQQRNIVRQWMGLPPLESNWQRAGRQAGLAANAVLQAAESSLALLAGQVSGTWRGLRSLTAESFMPSLPAWHFGPPGAAAQVPDTVDRTIAETLDAYVKGAAKNQEALIEYYTKGSSNVFCLASSKRSVELLFADIDTAEKLMAVCPTVECDDQVDQVNGRMTDATLVLQNGAALFHPLLFKLYEHGAKIFFSPRALDALDVNSKACIDSYRSAYTTLVNVTPANWTPAAGGSVVILSNEEFVEQLEAIRNVSYPSCNADALSCPSTTPTPTPTPTPSPTPSPTPTPTPTPNPNPNPNPNPTSTAGVQLHVPSMAAPEFAEFMANVRSMQSPQPADDVVHSDGSVPAGWGDGATVATSFAATVAIGIVGGVVLRVAVNARAARSTATVATDMPATAVDARSGDTASTETAGALSAVAISIETTSVEMSPAETASAISTTLDQLTAHNSSHSDAGQANDD